MKHWSLVAAGSIVVGVSAALFLSQARGNAAANERIAGLERRLEALSTDQQRAPERVVMIQAPHSEAEAEPEGEETASEPPSSREPGPSEALAPDPEAYRAALAVEFEAQPRDGRWSAETERAISAVLSTEDYAGTQLVASSCRQTMCKVELRHDTTSLQEDHLDKITQTPPFDVAGTVKPTQSPDGSASTLIFFAREGYDLPQPDVLGLAAPEGPAL